MKPYVAIITWCKNYNYGEVLQAYAMQKLFADKYRPLILSYQPGEETQRSFRIKKTLIYRGVRAIYRSVRPTSEIMDVRVKLFNTFRRTRFKKLYLCNSKEEVARRIKQFKCVALICGSDVVWDGTSVNGVFYLDFPEFPIPRMAYAPSFGSTIKMEASDTLCEERIRWWRNIDFLSTREKVSSKVVAELTGRDVTTVLDPTLMLTVANWDRVGCKPLIAEPYIFCYFLGEIGGLQEQMKLIQRQQGVSRIIYIKMPQNMDEHYGEELLDVGPAEFVSLVKNAKIVCTDSYHGTLFSINYQKPFYSFVRKTGGDSSKSDNRLENILEMLGIQNRLIRYGEVLDSIPLSVDYTLINKKLEKLRILSKEFAEQL